MKSKFFKQLLFFVLLIFFSNTVFVPDTFANVLCSSNGYTVLSINGIFTNQDGAKSNAFALKRKLSEDGTYNNQPLSIDYLYNPTHLAGAGDFVDAVEQGVFGEKSDYDLIEMLDDASEKVTTQKVLLVAHSQGNFYANNFYDKVASQEGGIPKESIGMYGVASPADRVAGDGKYLTSDTDSLIVARVGRFLKILPPNIHIELKDEADGNGHSFADVYMKYQGDKIVSDIKDSLDKLKENDEQEPDDPCISAQELSTIHKIQGVIFAVADPTAILVKGGVTTLYDASVYLANGARSIGATIGSNIHDLIFRNKNLSQGLPANVVTSLSGSDDAEKGESMNTQEKKEKIDPSPKKENNIVNLAKKENTEEGTFPNQDINDDSQPVLSDLVSYASIGGASVGGGSGSVGNGDNGGGGGDDEDDGDPPVPDTTKPVISIVGPSVVEITKGSNYVDAGATALDDIDGDITINIVTVNPVDINTVANYTITYNVKDAALNNAIQVERMIHVISPPAPDFPGVILDNSKTGGTWITTPFIGQWAAYCHDVVDVGVTCPSLLSNIQLKDIKKMRIKLLSGALPDGPNLLGVSIVGNDLTTFVHAKQLIAIGDGIYEYIFAENDSTQYLSWVVIQDGSGGNFTLDGSAENVGYTYGISNGYYPLVNGTFAYQLCDDVSGCGGGFILSNFSPEKKINTFYFNDLSPNVAGDIDENNHNVSLYVPFGTDITSLVPTITISSDASIIPNTNVAQNFTNPITYTVTAENGSIQNYIVTVTIAPDSRPVLVSGEVKSSNTVDLTFSKDLMGQTVTKADFSITPYTLPDSTIMLHTITFADEISPGVVQLTVSDTFAIGETPEIVYNINVSNGVKDLDSNTAPAKTIIATNSL